MSFFYLKRTFRTLLSSFFLSFLYLSVVEDTNLIRISFPEIRELTKNFAANDMTAPYIRGDIAMFHASASTVSSIIKTGSPYIIEECRLMAVKRGRADITINMMDHRIGENTIVFLGTGCVVQPQDFSPDIEVCGMMLSGERVGIALNGNSQAAIAGNGACLVTQTSPEEMDIADSMIDTIWRLIHADIIPEEAVNGLIHALLHYYEHLSSRHANAMGEAQRQGRTTFERYVALINAHCKQHHSLAFYADKLCITPRYLGVLIKEASGITAKEWLDRALATCAKVLLRHGDKQVAEIADELCFPNPSFFCKFFKRMTGVTPQQYRQGQ